jgi:hypothetical protein
MKKQLILLLFLVLTISCSKDDNEDSSNNAEEPRMGNSAITNIYATGKVAEQTTEQAKKTIFGKWDFGSSSSSARLASKNECNIESLEFTDDSYLIGISVPSSESISIYGTYDFKEENDKVVSVQLSSYFEGESVMVAEITDIVVEENNGIIDIAFNLTLKVDLGDYGVPCKPEFLNKKYAAEKDEPMEGTLEADETSNHYKIIGKYLATSFDGSDGSNLNDLLIESCVDYSYNYETQEEIKIIDEDCTSADTIQLELSTYGTYLYMELTQKTPLYIEQGNWSFNVDESKISINDPDGESFIVTISNLSESGMKMTIVDEEDGDDFTGIYVWEKR